MNLYFVCTSDNVLWEILRGKYPIILRMREQSVAGPVKEAKQLHANRDIV